MHEIVLQLSAAVKALSPPQSFIYPSLAAEIGFSAQVPFEYVEAIDDHFLSSRNSDISLANSIEDRHEDFYRSSSLLSMIVNAKVALSRRLAMRHPGEKYDEACMMKFVNYKDTILQQLHHVLTSDGHIDMSDDGQELSLPPQSLLHDFVKPYFKQLNPIMPILHYSTFVEGIKQIYADSNKHVEPAWILCINNLILFSLNARSKSGSTMSSAMDAGFADIKGILLKNAKRGLAKIEELSGPKLINAQALISMV